MCNGTVEWSWWSWCAGWDWGSQEGSLRRAVGVRDGKKDFIACFVGKQGEPIITRRTPTSDYLRFELCTDGKITKDGEEPRQSKGGFGRRAGGGSSAVKSIPQRRSDKQEQVKVARSWGEGACLTNALMVVWDGGRRQQQQRRKWPNTPKRHSCR